MEMACIFFPKPQASLSENGFCVVPVAFFSCLWVRQVRPGAGRCHQVPIGARQVVIAGVLLFKEKNHPIFNIQRILANGDEVFLRAYFKDLCHFSLSLLGEAPPALLSF